jgi:uncharacterized protein (TIGR02270 family)
MSVVPIVIQQHVEESAHLRRMRSLQVRAPHLRLARLGRLDERIAAHLDGISVAGAYGSELCRRALERPGKGQLFTATVDAIEGRDAARLDTLLATAGALPASQSGLLSAFGWVSANALRGITRPLLESQDPWWREVGIGACGMHGVDPGAVLDAALDDPDPRLRRRALRVAGRSIRVELRERCLAARADADPACAFEAARAALLLGDRRAAVDALEDMALAPGDGSEAALCLVLKVVASARARTLLAKLSKEPARRRALIKGIGAAGDAHFVPWLLGQMNDPRLARLAGESFSLITGLDLAFLDLDRGRPEHVEAGPNDDAEDDNVTMDEDEDLPWPDPQKIDAWWGANVLRFAAGTRSFIGQPPEPAHCVAILREGFQRQRAAAAVHLCLLKPGTPMFNTAAPARRQLRLLNAMGA